MKYLALLATLSVLSAALPESKSALQARADPDDLMEFDCSDVPEICTNMCYGAFCAGIGQSLNYDKPDTKEKRRRRRAAGCIASGGNRCSTKKGAPSGLQCDEYPFASTTSTKGGPRINRCVPATQNQKQGSTIAKFYRGSFCNGGPCKFNVAFGNPGADGVKYCDDNSCAKDDNEVTGPGGNEDPAPDEDAGDGTDDNSDDQTARRRRRRSPNMVPTYHTALGRTVAVPGGARIGQKTYRVEARNATLWDEQTENHTFDPDDDDDEYDYMLHNLEIRDDTIVARIN